MKYLDFNLIEVENEFFLFGLDQHSDRRGRGMHAIARIGWRDALDTVNPNLREQDAGTAARDGENTFLEPTGLRFTDGKRTAIPAPALGVAREHAR